MQQSIWILDLFTGFSCGFCRCIPRLARQTIGADDTLPMIELNNSEFVANGDD